MKTPFLGWIALDIDGTITHDKYSVPQEVISFLRQCHRDGWRIAMATGRPYTFATLALSGFDFPYLFLPQNGSFAMEMPAKKCLFTAYMSKSELAQALKVMQACSQELILYSGYEQQDRVYWRPERFDPEQTRYLKALWARQKEKDVFIEDFLTIPQQSFPLFKCFGAQKEMKVLREKLLETQLFNATLLRDPFEKDYCILLVTDRGASKGKSLEKAIDLLGLKGAIIAAGDDENDESMLQIADIAIAMHHSPASLQQLADYIAPPTSEMGIIHALGLAIRKYGNA